MNKNHALCATEDAWKEFERTGEITSNIASNLLSTVEFYKQQNNELIEALEFCVSEMKNYDFMCDETKCDAVIKLGDIEKLLAKAKGES